jgi:hypothetical protein
VGRIPYPVSDRDHRLIRLCQQARRLLKPPPADKPAKRLACRRFENTLKVPLGVAELSRERLRAQALMQAIFDQPDDALYRRYIARDASHADILAARRPPRFAESGMFAPPLDICSLWRIIPVATHLATSPVKGSS